MKYSLFMLSILWVSASAVFAADGKKGWDDDYAKASATAAKENKLMLLDFTGSDWCGYCMKLDAAVFSKPEFKAFAKANLELVELDFPNNKRQLKKTQTQNRDLAAKFKVTGYPTVILVDAAGKEQARWVGFHEDLMAELKAKVPAREEAKNR